MMISKGSVGLVFSTKIQNLDDEDNIIPQPLTDYTKLYIIFSREDGLEIQKSASPRDSDNLTNTDIVWTQPLFEDSIFDQRGSWDYRGAVKYSDGRYFESYDRIPFTVT